jgi:hypothetical protein
MTEYNQIEGLKFDNRSEIDTRFIDDIFVDQKGNSLEVELPHRDRIENEICIERYTGDYEVASCSIKIFESYITEVSENRVVVDFENMIDNNKLTF